MAFSITGISETTSTNDVIKQAIEDGMPEGTAVRADIQTGGYGRYGRSWKSPSGGMYMSVLLRPENHVSDGGEKAETLRKLPTLSLLTAIAVRRAIVSMLGNSKCGGCVLPSDFVKIKWPNDVVIEASAFAPECNLCSNADTAMFRKICGISLESHSGGICVGIGINILRPDGPSLPDANEPKRNIPVYLADLMPCTPDDIPPMAKAVIAELEVLYRDWLEVPFSHFSDEYNASLVLTGRAVEIARQDGSIEVSGKVQGIDGFGNLLIVPDGASDAVSVASGEAHVSLV